MSRIRDAFAANLTNVAFNGFDGLSAVTANGQARDVGKSLAADAAVRRKDGIEYAGEG